MRALGLVMASGLSLLVACGGDSNQKADDKPTQSAQKNESTTGTQGAKRIPADTFDEGCCERRNLDLNGDGEPDAYQFYVTKEKEIVVMRKEVDINFDGKIDLVRNFDERGNVVNERLDTDFDGKIDVVNFFEKGKIVRKEYDTNFDAAVDVFAFYEQGQITRQEKDLNHDGKIDFWEYYENGVLDRSGIDRDGDGEVDEWETLTRSEG